MSEFLVRLDSASTTSRSSSEKLKRPRVPASLLVEKADSKVSISSLLSISITNHIIDNVSVCASPSSESLQMLQYSSNDEHSTESPSESSTTPCGEVLTCSARALYVHDPYSLDSAIKWVPANQALLTSSPGSVHPDDKDDSDSESCLNAPQRRKAQCPYGHLDGKRLRFRKGKGHYVCETCGIRWKRR